MDFLIPAELHRALLDYLAQRPYREVANVIPLLANLQPAGQKQGVADDK